MKLIYHESIQEEYNQSRNLDKPLFYTSQQQYCQLDGRKVHYSSKKSLHFSE